MITDIDEIKELAQINEDDNWALRSFLKEYDAPTGTVDSLVHELFEEVSAEIDCKTCGNCCKEVLPVLDEEDVKKFSKGLGLSADEFESQYLVEEEEGFSFTEKPCPFLKDNVCSNYDCRPRSCVSFPHLHKDNFTSRLMGVIDNYSICPIVFNVYERLKEEIPEYNDIDEFDNFDDFDLFDDLS